MRGSRVGKSQPFQTFDYPPYLPGLGGLSPDPVVTMPLFLGSTQSLVFHAIQKAPTIKPQ
ncbi:hypothetical protein A7J57_10360 [Agrobacterium tumefaciens]|uniref:Uncharacterized protein n=1 Tax=Agrobacterium tumefaciens TaxID=358 RepID=A0A176X1V5_AGRTU|nr:hypothetical protein A7J57_10360 [Agrobacterium tumefaciens]